jgi:hypothetical protein
MVLYSPIATTEPFEESAWLADVQRNISAKQVRNGADPERVRRQPCGQPDIGHAPLEHAARVIGHHSLGGQNPSLPDDSAEEGGSDWAITPARKINTNI